MKTLILSIALILLSFLSFGHNITYSISYRVGDSLTVYTNDNPADFKETLLNVRTMLHDDFENSRILEADFNRVEAYIQNEIESLILSDLEPVKTKVVAPIKSKPIKTITKPLNVPQEQLAVNDVKEIIYIVSYGLGDEVMSYESSNIIDYAIDLQDAIDFLNEDLFNERITLDDFNKANDYFSLELDKIFLNNS